MRSHATPTRGLGLVLVFPLNLIVVSGKDDIRSTLCASARCFLVTAAEHQLAGRVVNTTPVCSQCAIARRATPGILGQMGTSSKWLVGILSQNPIAD